MKYSEKGMLAVDSDGTNRFFPDADINDVIQDTDGEWTGHRCDDVDFGIDATKVERNTAVPVVVTIQELY